MKRKLISVLVLLVLVSGCATPFVVAQLRRPIEISDSLPEGVALIIYGARKVGEMDFERLVAQVKDEIKGRVGELHWALQDIYPYQKPPEIPFRIPRKVFWPKAPIFITTPKELPEIVIDRNFTIRIDVADAPINLNISNSLISNVSVRLRETIRNVTIYFEKLVEKPPEVPSPPGLVYAYHKIDVNVPEASIEKADITFWVLKEWLATQGATKDDVVMLRYHGGEWLRLPTRAIGENATHFKFTAETPGFSIFAVAITVPVRVVETGVEGYVFDNATGEPIKGARIIALPKVITLVRAEATADDMGHYLLSLAPGSYVLVVSANGYADASAEVSLALGEVKRVDFRLEKAVAEFSENWYGVKFEVAILGNLTWEVGGDAPLKVSAAVNDMGGNQKIEFRQLTLELILTGVKVSVPINLATSIGGAVFSKPISVRVLDGFGLHAPGETKGYSLQVILEGSVVDKFGIEWPGLTLEAVSVNIYAPEAPVSVEFTAPSKVKIGDEFDVKLRFRNEGKHPISDLKVSLSLPFGASAIGPTETAIRAVNPKEAVEVVFRLKAEIATTSSVTATYSYRALWGYFVSELLKTLGSITITKIPVSLTISVEPREVTVGEEAVVKGSISPAMSKTIELAIKRPDGTTDTQTTTSAPDGSFGFRIKLDKEGEWSFTAKFAGDLTYEGTVSAEVKATAKPKPGPCLIATAAFGTELDPHVQHLRGFRDRIVLRTFAGSSFMRVFNAWYYSWSPYVASAMQAYEPLRQAVKYALYPLISILHTSEALYEALSFSPEAGVVAAGIIASLLIGLVYFAPPSIAIMRLTGRWPSKRAAKLTALIWLAAITGTGVSIIAGSSAAAMAFTSTLVLASSASSVVLAAQLIRRCIRCRCPRP
ncbi:MAG: PGF-pre-PGF domain-containing protein [Candidatus Bathyarchaeia archaeon]